MLFTAIGVLSVVLGFSLAIHVMFEKIGSKISAWSIFTTAVMGTIFSLITGIVMLFVIWPPVNVFSWLVFAGFTAGVAWVALANNKDGEDGTDVNAVNNNRVDLRSGTGG